MANKNPVRQLLDEAKELDGPLAAQRDQVMRALRKHEFRHKWVVRTATTFFWAGTGAACLLGAITRREELLVAAVFWLLLGSLVYVQSRFRRIELKIDEVLARVDDWEIRGRDLSGAGAAVDPHDGDPGANTA